MKTGKSNQMLEGYQKKIAQTKRKIRANFLQINIKLRDIESLKRQINSLSTHIKYIEKMKLEIEFVCDFCNEVKPLSDVKNIGKKETKELCNRCYKRWLDNEIDVGGVK